MLELLPEGRGRKGNVRSSFSFSTMHHKEVNLFWNSWSETVKFLELLQPGGELLRGQVNSSSLPLNIRYTFTAHGLCVVTLQVNVAASLLFTSLTGCHGDEKAGKKDIQFVRSPDPIHDANFHDEVALYEIWYWRHKTKRMSDHHYVVLLFGESVLEKIIFDCDPSNIISYNQLKIEITDYCCTLWSTSFWGENDSLVKTASSTWASRPCFFPDQYCWQRYTPASSAVTLFISREQFSRTFSLCPLFKSSLVDAIWPRVISSTRLFLER